MLGTNGGVGVSGVAGPATGAGVAGPSGVGAAESEGPPWQPWPLPPVPVGEWAAPPGLGTPSWVWAVVGVAGMVMLAVVAAIAVPVVLGVRDLPERRQLARADVSPPGLVAPASVAGLRRNRDPQVERLVATVMEQGSANGAPNIMAAAYGPDSRSRLLVVTAIQTSAEGARRAFTRHASTGLASGAGVTGTTASTEITRGGTTFRCTTFGPAGATSSFCTWDDGDLAGLGLGTGTTPYRLAGLLAAARAKIGR
jgi:hypothetical protein